MRGNYGDRTIVVIVGSKRGREVENSWWWWAARNGVAGGSYRIARLLYQSKIAEKSLGGVRPPL